MKTLSVEQNFLAIDEEYSSYNNSQIVILPAPYEHTTSYGAGAAAGPQAIIDASHYVEFYDDEFDSELCFDRGIATLPPINFGEKVDGEALELIENAVDKLLADGKIVVTLGGEHTISTAPIKSHFKKYPNMSLLHFDAHSDLRESYEGSLYSHASFMSRVVEFFGYDKITQVGIRAQCVEEARLIKEKNIKTFYATQIRRNKWGNNWQKAVADTLGDEVYVTFDIDCFDPSLIPATGTPEPNGMFYAEILDVFYEMQKQGKKIVGFDLVELAPIEGLSHPDMTAARLAYKMMHYLR